MGSTSRQWKQQTVRSRALYNAAFRKGIQVPKDISVTGFDNMPESKFFHPPLTTVHHDFDLLGITSLRYVAQAIANPNLPRRHHKIIPELVIHESVRVASSGNTLDV